LNAWIKYVEYKKSMKNEEQFGLLVEQMQEGLAIHEIILDEKGIPADYRFLSVNDSFERLTGLSKKDIINKRVLEVLPKTERYWVDLYGKVALTGVPNHYENYSVELDRYFSVTAFSPKKNQFAVMITDISEDKRKQKEIEFLSFHDQLTGIYNRRFYENAVIELDRECDLPLAMVMIDVNGLKLTNDAFGHKAGDNLLQKTADILTAKCRKDDIAARIGGDEFILLLPRTDLAQARMVIRGITDIIAQQKIDHIILSVSIGSSVKNSISENLMDVFKKAEDEMYRHKLSESSSMRSKTIDLIMNTLYEKNNREMLHSKRVGKICETIAENMGFDKDAVSQMRIAGLMHDIGKIGLYENILTKKEELNTSEWDEIERHSEVGYRILSSLNEFSEIADYVLEHHEHWDGHGYPRGLKAGEISLQARIISIADAFDAMTSDRTYRKSLSEEEAVQEIFKCSGTQFDPAIARVFVEKVMKREWEKTAITE
jgi:diguanylate cyclase (GGDEF)-like protein/putative nucleotidyltransferase with HDIG domain/PAS domain S-box-containing protein